MQWAVDIVQLCKFFLDFKGLKSQNLSRYQLLIYGNVVGNIRCIITGISEIVDILVPIFKGLDQGSKCWNQVSACGLYIMIPEIGNIGRINQIGNIENIFKISTIWPYQER